ncbi:hypothetical protein BOTBODRAFT_100830 [Botryobasidium botryosum FD-172 SS1]|uniref:Metal homeostatis protein bsd2 n=1 Tax=Botryobasidium botryosum (strain FD-172 SS1) TaxID=930990 RepID=A0A067MYD4_BOTB1|nr:hypothetical protein BOTBODRAFT_100830 [Botryobasidium botryosum FD-172 SS1]
MEAAFDDSDDEGDVHDHSQKQYQPLLTERPDSPITPTHPLASPSHYHHHSFSSPQTPATPGIYDFEYDYPPPPGSPPRPSALALPGNTIGNSNGIIPDTPVVHRDFARPSFFRRALGAILPSQNTVAARGSGVENDGVFANIAAKPSTGPVNTGSNTAWPGEEEQSQAPPSYATAQADAVPPYWENTILAPHAPHGDGELIVDNLPTGSIFSFLWNFLISMSFQYVGFLLTFLLHTTHAAKYGSRAGLGVTMIQYGFYLRTGGDKLEDDPTNADFWWGPPQAGNDTMMSHHHPGHGSSTSVNSRFHPRQLFTSSTPPTASTSATPPTPPTLYNGTSVISGAPSPSDMEELSAATEWFSFILMTVGWFLLLTSLLNYWRVKRWERQVQTASAGRAEYVVGADPLVAFAAPSTPRESEGGGQTAQERRRRLFADVQVSVEAIRRRAEEVRGRVGLAGLTWSDRPTSPSSRERRAEERERGAVEERV